MVHPDANRDKVQWKDVQLFWSSRAFTSLQAENQYPVMAVIRTFLLLNDAVEDDFIIALHVAPASSSEELASLNRLLFLLCCDYKAQTGSHLASTSCSSHTMGIRLGGCWEIKVDD